MENQENCEQISSFCPVPKDKNITYFEVTKLPLVK